MTILYNGWTTPVIENPIRSEAGFALGMVQDLMGSDKYVEWFSENINSSTPWADVLQMARDLLDGGHRCEDDRVCTCKPGNDDIPY